jgi:DNA invertase Pin-like site-specific DNA recombinase
MKPKRAAIYLRVSDADESTVENQRLQLRAVAERRGWEIITEYKDEGISGAKGRDKRPGLDRLLKDAKRGKFGVIMAWAIDRLGRSLLDLLTTMNDLHAYGVDIYLDQQNIDATTPMGRLVFQVTGAFAEFELAMIKTRINAGIARARVKGTKSGRAIGRPKTDEKIEAAAAAMLKAGTGIRKTARTLDIGVSVVQRVSAAL